jgi:RNA polymerase sigma-70 factor (ECF subfamily)
MGRKDASLYKSVPGRCLLGEVQSDPPTSESWAAPLYDATAAQLVLYGRALGLSEAEAEDVLHDTFRVLLGTAQVPREPRSYLVRSFRNRALNHRRSLWRRLNRELESLGWFEQDGAETPAERSAVAGLGRLPAAQREVIVLKLWHALTFEEIGEILGISPHTAAGRYRYGLEKLRADLQEQETPHHESTGEPEPGNRPAWLPAAPAVPEG